MSIKYPFLLLSSLAFPGLAARADAAETEYFVDIAPCMEIRAEAERAACYDSLAGLVRRLRETEVPVPPAPPQPPAPVEPPAPPAFEDQGLGVLRIEKGNAAAYRLDGDMGVWVDPSGGGVNVLLILRSGP